MEFTPELLQKAVRAEDAGTLAELVWSEGLTLTTEQAEDYFAKLHPPAGELADDELEAVSGGG